MAFSGCILVKQIPQTIADESHCPALSARKSPLTVAFRNTRKVNDMDSLMTQVLQEEDYRSFEKLFHLSYNPLLSFCSKLVPSHGVAEELVSEVFVKIWKNRKRIVISSSGKSYLFTSVRNMAFDYMRKEKNQFGQT